MLVFGYIDYIDFIRLPNWEQIPKPSSWTLSCKTTNIKTSHVCIIEALNQNQEKLLLLYLSQYGEHSSDINWDWPCLPTLNTVIFLNSCTSRKHNDLGKTKCYRPEQIDYEHCFCDQISFCSDFSTATLVAVWPWANYLISLYLSFLINKRGIKTIISP